MCWVLADVVVAYKVVVPIVGSTSRSGNSFVWFWLLLLGLLGFAWFCLAFLDFAEFLFGFALFCLFFFVLLGFAMFFIVLLGFACCLVLLGFGWF